jgi:hypothetical protein
MRARDRKVPIAELATSIRDLLKTGPRTIGEVARELGYSIVAVRARLEQLELDQLAHRRQIQIQAWSGVCFLWYEGPADGAALKLGEALATPGGPTREQQVIIPFQATVRTYPAVNRRDPLVAALFGSARL